LNDEAKTRAVFLEDPFLTERGENGVRMYRTGDVGCFLPDGNILLFGRKDHQIKIRGHRIELGEIENALMQLDYVHQAVALDFRDRSGQRKICGYVTLKAGTDENEASLAQELAEKLPEYLTPSVFVILDKLPLQRNGKIDRKALPAPDASNELRKTSYAAPGTPEEEALCLIWSEVLRVERPGIHDNFFALGGDSILSMQIVSRAGRAGLKLMTSQVFEYQTIAELARVAIPITVVDREKGEIRGPLPLTAIQQRFFLQQKAEQHHYNQSLMVEGPVGLDAALLHQAIEQITLRHDALRLRFHRDGDKWLQQLADVKAAALGVEDLSHLADDAQLSRIDEVCALVQASLNLSEGPLLRAVLFQMGRNQRPLLLLVAHHLVIDGVSWRILLEELAAVYRQLRENESVHVPDQSTSFTAWASLVTEAAKSHTMLDSENWHRLASVRVSPLPLDTAAGPEANIVDSAGEITTHLSEEATQSLLQRTSRAYNTQINDLLLAALAITLGEWTGDAQVLVDIEGHGRESWIENTDLSRTVGWFTTLFPFVLTVPAGAPGAIIKSVKEQIRHVPSRGLTYGVLRYLTNDPITAAQPQAQVIFNYLGQFDQLLSGESEWKLSSISTGPDRSEKQKREYLLEVNSYVLDGCLHTNWGFSRNLHSEATVRHLADNYGVNLEMLIRHCLEPEAFGFTESDFPVARISQSSLDELAGQLNAVPRQALRDEVEDIYELTSTQQGILFHGLYVPESEAYFTQVTCLIEGDLETKSFFAAWQQTVNRHPILRSSFHWDGIEKPVQVVHRSVSLPWKELDFSALEDAEALESWSRELQQSRQLGFDTTTAPLMRWNIAAVGHSRWRFNWSLHHILMDGWSASLILGEVLETYTALRNGREAELPHPRPFRDMVRWLHKRDGTTDEQFWKEKLADFTAPTPLMLGRPEMEGKHAPAHNAEHGILISAAATAKLTTFTQDNQLSLNTLAQAAWSLLLRRYSGETDVVYGSIF